MITLTFDKGLDHERSVHIANFHERPLTNSFNGTNSIVISKEEDVPALPDLGQNPYFETVEAVNGGGVAIPLQGDYNRITDFFAAYDDESKRYNINISLGYVAEEVQDEQ